ncbi:hypothetical protein DPMN_089998 [Dreissena polymorpha]|uniref:Uncharacterized protein n=1 Tax=Dreissena polymorpha TaxID=45954 RepID=A0A9D4QYP3_DREPO|nr:hypothetical protein DPMN_089998 [Dreissena polymorpha]
MKNRLFRMDCDLRKVTSSLFNCRFFSISANWKFNSNFDVGGYNLVFFKSRRLRRCRSLYNFVYAVAFHVLILMLYCKFT